MNAGTEDEACADTAAAARTVAPITDETALEKNMLNRDVRVLAKKRRGWNDAGVDDGGEKQDKGKQEDRSKALETRQ